MRYFLDFEASSLSDTGYPIEVAWVDESGQGEGYLIRPTEEWLSRKGAWSVESEAVHGISIAVLMADGKPASYVARRAAAVLRRPGNLACSDAPAFDGRWLRTLLDVLGEDVPVVPFPVSDLREAVVRASWEPMLAALPALPSSAGPARAWEEERLWLRAEHIADRCRDAEFLRGCTRHRAMPDALSMWRTWKGAGRLGREAVLRGPP